MWLRKQSYEALVERARIAETRAQEAWNTLDRAESHLRLAEARLTAAEERERALNDRLLERADHSTDRLVQILRAPRDEYLQPAQPDPPPPAGWMSEDGLNWIDESEAEVIPTRDLIDEFAEKMGL